MMNEKIAKILENEEIVRKLDATQSDEEFCRILMESGADVDDINGFMEYLSNMKTDGELSEEALEDVAGGAPVLQTIFCKWVYRFQHKKIFVKATVKGNYIVVTNRFGEKVSEEYMYR